jgi:hypothetical protein
MYDQYGYVLTEKEGQRYRQHIESREVSYLVTSLPMPPQPPQEYYAKEGESYQFIAYKFLQDPMEWWQVADANPQIWYPFDLTMGSYLHVPT